MSRIGGNYAHRDSALTTASVKANGFVVHGTVGAFASCRYEYVAFSVTGAIMAFALSHDTVPASGVHSRTRLRCKIRK